MTNAWRHWFILRAASLLAPSDQRAEWLEWWRSELWYIPQREATRFCLGAFRDAFGLRRNGPSLPKRSRIYSESPLTCLGVLATLTAASILMAARVNAMLPFPEEWGGITFRSIAATLLMYLLLTASALLVWRTSGYRRLMPPPSTPRSWIFLALKIALILPTLQCALTIPVAIDWPFLSPGFHVTHFLLFRWAFMDQHRRCPVCLRLLTNPVRIGVPSRTFLDWYGSESVCVRGHGLLHSPEISASYCAEQQWLSMDDSWAELFPSGARLRP